MTPRIPTDDDLRLTADNQCEPRFVRDLARELLEHRAAEIARRAAASEGFAAGARVTLCGSDEPHTVLASDEFSLWTTDTHGRYHTMSIAACTPVPPAPTAIEVFAEAWNEARTGDTAGERSRAAFREFCREAGIPADEPLGAGK